jgi:hypothetical protein
MASNFSRAEKPTRRHDPFEICEIIVATGARLDIKKYPDFSFGEPPL